MAENGQIKTIELIDSSGASTSLSFPLSSPIATAARRHVTPQDATWWCHHNSIAPSQLRWCRRGFHAPSRLRVRHCGSGCAIAAPVVLLRLRLRGRGFGCAIAASVAPSRLQLRCRDWLRHRDFDCAITASVAPLQLQLRHQRCLSPTVLSVTPFALPRRPCCHGSCAATSAVPPSDNLGLSGLLGSLGLCGCFFLCCNCFVSRTEFSVILLFLLLLYCLSVNMFL